MALSNAGGLIFLAPHCSQLGHDQFHNSNKQTVISKISWFFASVNVSQALQSDIFSINSDCGNYIEYARGREFGSKSANNRHRRMSVRIAKQSSHPNHSEFRGSGSQEISANKMQSKQCTSAQRSRRTLERHPLTLERRTTC
jgi:hypothetical protein